MAIYFYAALLAFLYVFLSIRIIKLRRKFKVGIGDGGSETVTRAIRAHANFAEYVPLALILIFLAETQQWHIFLINILGFLLVLGRISHAYGVSQSPEDFRFRVFGMACTFTSIMSASLLLLLDYLI